jgi:hypothetical protein
VRACVHVCICVCHCLCVCVYLCMYVRVSLCVCVCVGVCVLTDRTAECTDIPSFYSLKLLKTITPYGLTESFPFSAHVCLYAILSKTSFNCRVGVPSAPKLGQSHHFPATARKHLLMTFRWSEKNSSICMLFRSS